MLPRTPHSVVPRSVTSALLVKVSALCSLFQHIWLRPTRHQGGGDYDNIHKDKIAKTSTPEETLTLLKYMSTEDKLHLVIAEHSWLSVSVPRPTVLKEVFRAAGPGFLLCVDELRHLTIRDELDNQTYSTVTDEIYFG
eukprot:Protomagalhaensia_wolfi_Nauph_80__6347@NODE_995_length_1824_cov_3144_891877_g752_i0_p1_GENE_NODE_995_length_1824_cov_3144_891877_g752_i0NODE_995_length_1824_cov_3144_891877_g752_i0_p1_ORF_typecomplete_len138_score11_65DUF4253/PF14062_6/0_18_NODE_995_length_1824_cov_3144_891877_g752_i011191532